MYEMVTLSLLLFPEDVSHIVGRIDYLKFYCLCSEGI